MSRLISSTLFVLVLLSTARIARAQEQGRLMRDYVATELAFERGMILDAYEAHGSHDPAWNDDAIAFLEACSLWFASSPDKASVHDLIAQGEGLVVERECDDAMVRYCLGYLWDTLAHDNKAYGPLRQSQQMLTDQEYPYTLRAVAAARYAIFLREYEFDAERVEEMQQYAANLAVEAIRQGEFRGHEELIIDTVYPLIQSNFPATMSRSMVEEIATLGVDLVPEYVAEYLRGHVEVRTAWSKRGSGFANTVDEDGWRGFNAHLAAANEHLSNSWRLNPQSPWAAAEMVTVAMGDMADPGETIFSWHERAVDAMFDWPQSYSAVLWALRPRWSGSHHEMLEFGRRCAKTERYDTTVPFWFVRAACDVASDLSQNGGWVLRYWTDPDVNALADEVLARLLANPAHQSQARRYTTMRAALAWAIGDYSRSREFIDALNDDLDTEALDELHMQVNASLILEDVCLYSEPIAPLAEQGENAWWSGDYDRAIASYRAILDGAGDDRLLRAVASDKLAAVTIARDLAAGEWVDLRFDESLSGWTPRNGTWRRIDDKTVEGQIGWGDGVGKGLTMALDVGVGPRFEIEGRADMRNIVGNRWPNFAMMCNWDVWGSRWQSVSFYPRNNKVSHKYAFEGSDLTDAEFDEEFAFRVRVWDGKAVVSINDEVVLSGPFLGRIHVVEDGQIGLGSWVQYLHGSIRLSDLRLRLLEAQPAELGDASPY